MIKRGRPSFTAVLKAANAKCSKCGSQNDLQINHKTPIVNGGTNDWRNLEILCKKCHEKYHGIISKKSLR